MFLEFFSFIITSLLNIVNQLGYIGILVGMTVESSFIPFPSEIILIPAGALIAKGELSFPLVFLASLTGSLIGASFNYFIAYTLGRKSVNFLIGKYGKFLFITNSQLKKTDEFFARQGQITTFVGRLIPIVRQLISLPAGFARMNLKDFIIFTAVGSGLWTLVLLYLGYFFGNNYALLTQNLEIITIILAVISVFILIASLLLRKRKKSLVKN